MPRSLKEISSEKNKDQENFHFWRKRCGDHLFLWPCPTKYNEACTYYNFD